MNHRWLTRKVTVPAGTYSTATVTEHYTEDGEFSVRPEGGMRHALSHGCHGRRSLRWIWSGFSLRDHRPVETWRSLAGHFATVKQAKARVARRQS